MFLKISQNSQENICPSVSFLIKLRAWGPQLYKKETLAQVFSYEYCKSFKKTYFEEHLWTAASGCSLENHVEIEPQRFTDFNLFYLH